MDGRQEAAGRRNPSAKIGSVATSSSVAGRDVRNPHRFTAQIEGRTKRCILAIIQFDENPKENAMNLDALHKVATAMVAPGRGILAADESSGTIKRRFDAIGTENTEDNRRDYREFLFRSNEAMTKYISGVILYDETIRQHGKDGTPLVKLIEKAGSIPGIKVDGGTKPLPFCAGEVITEGLDGLGERLAEYRGLGAKFAKWRAVIDIGPNMPSYACLITNTHALARYAALCQQAEIVPIVEPEVLMDGDHDIDRCYMITEWVLKTTFEQLYYQKVALEGMVLKPNMVVPGKKSPKRASVAEVAEKTVKLLKACVPASVPGIAFLSGGQSDEEATAHLDAMNKIGGLPWGLTFSYGRALQAAPQKAWGGKSENVVAAQRAFTHRAMMNSLAALGQWKQDLEKKAA
jgi:fructose-bisphosphate aldolase class I